MLFFMSYYNVYQALNAIFEKMNSSTKVLVFLAVVLFEFEPL